MNHQDHVNLLRPADVPSGASFADLGAGSGAFTLALRELLGLSADIYAVDRDRGRLSELERSHRARFGESDHLHIIAADFTGVEERELLPRRVGDAGQGQGHLNRPLPIPRHARQEARQRQARRLGRGRG